MNEIPIVFSLNSYTFASKLGPMRTYVWNEEFGLYDMEIEPQPETSTLLGLLVRMGANSYRAIEVAYGHLHDTTHGALREIRHVAEISRVELASLLLDFGDLSTDDPVRAAADMTMYKQWIDIAAEAGFSRLRLEAGEARPDDAAAITRAADRLLELAEYAKPAQIWVMTENLGSLLSTSDNCLKLIGLCRGNIGFTADYGNFEKDKYKQLADVLLYAETVHAKAATDEAGRIDAEDYRRCLSLTLESGFEGSLSLTYLGDADPWPKLGEMRAFAEEILKVTA
ncbi:sugar phosphate isomerase/epimerase family protein [Cohnella lupini]|uniref:Sugar phosphate isomerase/epimerase n=1 Tax=Cohnella lupini TaxID=1294267 RepID=A0A3D9HQC7_9BACL|nr:TIM barrel protein [Cohnella lupini]RED51707.1 sugar phosphate isomerase/epimerase [Cohnella lupini]